MTKQDIELLNELRKKIKIYSNVVILDFADKDSELRHLIKLLRGIELEFESYLKDKI